MSTRAARPLLRVVALNPAPRSLSRAGLLPEPPAFAGKDSRFADRLLMPGSEMFYGMTVLVLVLCFSEGLSATRDIHAYLRDGSNLVDLVTLMLCVVAFGLRAAADYYLPQSLATLRAPPWGVHGTTEDPFPSINTSAWCTEWMRNTITLALFMLYARILKYLQRVPGLDVIQRTFKRASTDLAAFAVVFLVVFVAYAIALEFIFGQELSDFRSFFRTLHTLLRALTGDLDAAAMFKDERFIGFISLLTFNLLVVFTLLTLLVAILSDAFIIEKAAIGHLKRKQRIRELIAFVGQRISLGSSALDVAGRSLQNGLQRLRGTTRTLLSSPTTELTRVHVVLWSGAGLQTADSLTEPDPYVLLHVLPDEAALHQFLAQGSVGDHPPRGEEAPEAPPPPMQGAPSLGSVVLAASQRGRDKGAFMQASEGAAVSPAAQDDAQDAPSEGATPHSPAAGSTGAASSTDAASPSEADGGAGKESAPHHSYSQNARRTVRWLRDGVKQVVVGAEEADKLQEPRRVHRFPEKDATTDPEWHEQCEVYLKPYEVPSATRHGRRHGGWLLFTVWDLQAGAPDRMQGITAFPLDLLPRNGDPVTTDLHLQVEGWTPTRGLPPAGTLGHLHVSLSLRLLKSAASRLISMGVRGGRQQRGEAEESPLPAGLRRGVFPAWSSSSGNGQHALADQTGATGDMRASSRDLRRRASMGETTNPMTLSRS